jgi:hypothetical protein
MPAHTVSDNSILEAALIGLQHQHSELTQKIAEIHRRLGIRAPRTTSTSASPVAAPRKGRMSAAARKRIGEATRKRWAAYRAQKAAAKKPAIKKASPKKETAAKKVKASA